MIFWLEECRASIKNKKDNWLYKNDNWQLSGFGRSIWICLIWYFEINTRATYAIHVDIATERIHVKYHSVVDHVHRKPYA